MPTYPPTGYVPTAWPARYGSLVHAVRIALLWVSWLELPFSNHEVGGGGVVIQIQSIIVHSFLNAAVGVVLTRCALGKFTTKVLFIFRAGGWGGGGG